MRSRVLFIWNGNETEILFSVNLILILYSLYHILDSIKFPQIINDQIRKYRNKYDISKVDIIYKT